MLRLIPKIKDFFALLLFPPICYICSEEAIKSQILCATCIEDIQYNQEYNFITEVEGEWEQIYSFFYFDKTIKSLIYKLKISKELLASKLLNHFIASRDWEMLQDWDIDVITYVPTHWTKSFLFYDHAQVIAKIIATKLKIPLKKTLRKSFSLDKQAKKNKKSRLKYKKNIFKIQKKCNLKNKNVLLVDDVLTTGRTVAQCTELLNKKQVENIFVVTLAKG